MRSKDDQGDNYYLLQQGQPHTGTQEFTQMVDGKLAEGPEDILLNFLRVFIGIVWVVGDDHRREIRTVNGVVDGNCDFVLTGVVNHGTNHRSPH